MRRKPPWFRRLNEFVAGIEAERDAYRLRCQEIGEDPKLLHRHIWRDLIAKAVHESNWQEGVHLDENRTRELEDEAYNVILEYEKLKGPHLDLELMHEMHTGHIKKLKQLHASLDEIAAFNLSAAHHFLFMLQTELTMRWLASVLHVIRDLLNHRESMLAAAEEKGQEAHEKLRDHLERGERLFNEVNASSPPNYGPLTEEFQTNEEFMSGLMSIEFNELLHPMHIEYIHMLHRLTMCGITDVSKIGRYRRKPATVGGFLALPSPAVVPSLMKEYCNEFPMLTGRYKISDAIRIAARESYRFVRIHPYPDGNGRVSRLIMNLVLLSEGHPPVYLKADGTGRKRYHYALKRANDGSYEALEALIASSLLEVYQLLIKSLAKR